MDYTNYTVEALASEDSFIQWANRSNAEAEKFWDDFIAKHPEMDLKIAQARRLVLNLRQAESSHHSKELVDSLWNGIEQRIERDMPVPSTRSKKYFSIRLSMATALAAAFIAAAVWFGVDSLVNTNDYLESQPFFAETEYIEEVNTSGNILRVHLSDGSIVSLENNSRLAFKKTFPEERFRAVYLKGEAFFEVAKDATRPFLVHTNEVVTRVLGTSFRVKALEDEGDVIVSVKTGKVSVYTITSENTGLDAKKNAVILLPNQQVTYLREYDSFGKALVPEPDIVLPGVKETDFTFENTPIKEVFMVLQKFYGIEIIFDEEIMRNCFITAPLGSEPLFEKLRIICRTIGARFETIDAKVVITSTGC